MIRRSWIRAFPCVIAAVISSAASAQLHPIAHPFAGEEQETFENFSYGYQPAGGGNPSSSTGAVGPLTVLTPAAGGGTAVGTISVLPDDDLGGGSGLVIYAPNQPRSNNGFALGRDDPATAGGFGGDPAHGVTGHALVNGYGQFFSRTTLDLNTPMVAFGGFFQSGSAGGVQSTVTLDFFTHQGDLNPAESFSFLPPDDPGSLLWIGFNSDTAFSRIQFTGYDVAMDNLQISSHVVVPEPCSMIALALGSALVLRRRKRA